MKPKTAAALIVIASLIIVILNIPISKSGSFDNPNPEPDLECEGELLWTDVKPGSTVNGSFIVKNVGDPGSLLDWEIVECPEWGDWTFNPWSGDDLEVTVETDKPIYRWLIEPVVITLTIENTGEEEITLTFPTTQMFDFEICNDRFGWRVFRWSDGKFFFQIIINVTIPPGESLSWNYSWRQLGHIIPWNIPFYRPVFPGRFSITGQIPTIDNVYEDTVEIRIGPYYGIP